MMPVARVTIHRLPDNVLLDVSDFYREDASVKLRFIEIIFSPPPRGGGKYCHKCVEDGEILSLDHLGGLACAWSSPTKLLRGPGRCWISGHPYPSPCFALLCLLILILTEKTSSQQSK